MKTICTGLLSIVLLCGCSEQHPAQIEPNYYHDSAHKVSCWVTYYAMQCLPDKQVDDAK